MRTIKFRAWDGKKMDYEPLATDRYQEDSINDEFAESDSVYMQFTGLKDKNGKEIYEGDIVAVSNEHPVITKCIYEPGFFTLKDNADGHWTRQLFHQPDRLTVIGNIHESPELLK